MDFVQQQLRLLDKRLAGRWAFHRDMVGSCPVAFLAAGMIFGIILQRYFEFSHWLWFAFLVLFFSAAIFFFIYAFSTKKFSPTVLAYLALACAVSLGGIRFVSYKHAPANDIRNLVGDERTLATIRGVIITQPYTRYKDDWSFAKFSHSDPSSSFYLELKEVETVDGWAEVCGKIRVFINEPILDLKAGHHIRAYCWLGRFKGSTNPGGFDLADYLAKRNVYIGASIQSRDAIEIIRDTSSHSLSALKNYFHRIANAALLNTPSMTEDEKGLLEALLLGYRGNVDSDTYRAFERTGLLHFISLSGMHLGILVGIVWWLSARLGLLKRARAALCIFVILIFLLVVPARPPTLRAALIFFIFCLAAFFRRYPNPINSLSVAAVILLLIRPTSLFEAGFQLSFAAVLGILFFVDGIDTFIQEKLYEPLATILYKIRLYHIWSYSLSIFSVGLAAWLGGAGILLYHFQSITPLAPLWTVIAFPFIACILAFGFFKMIIAFLLPTVAALLTLILGFLSQTLIAIVKLLSGINFSQILVGHIPLEVVLLYYSVIAVIAWSWFLRPGLRIIVSACAVLIFAVTIASYKWQRTFPDELQVACLDVGHGQAIVMHAPGGTFLFDAGSQYNRNIGRYVVNAFLRYNGISKIDAIIISHDDIDHFNGVVEIVRNCTVKNIYAPSDFIYKTKDNGSAKYLCGLLAEQGYELEPVPAEIKSNCPPKIKVLWPDKTTAEYESLSDNDKSAVALIEFAGRKILLCADIEHFAQQKLLERFEELYADIVVVPHHGSLSTSDPRFLKSLDARYLIVSCGVGDLHRLQNNEIEIGGRWFYTGRDGAVIVNINKSGEIRIDSYR